MNLAVSKVHFQNGQALSFLPGEIVLVVGKNSSGKSTFLREISACLADFESHKKIIKDITFAGASVNEIEKRVYSYFRVIEEGPLRYVPDDRGNAEFHLPALDGDPNRFKLGKASQAFVTLLNAEGRLALTRDVDTIDIHITKARHPFHMFMVDPAILASASAVIKRAFSLNISINRIGNPIRGYVAPEFADDNTLSGDRSLPQVAERLVAQGDGLRSYVGIIGELHAMSHPIVLIDEPEAFLHPPQAKRLGRDVVTGLGPDRQAFIATHNSNFLQGAIANLESRIRVLRLGREGKASSVTDIGHGSLKEAEKLPAVANTNLLDSLFYDRTVICEADADAKLFERLLSRDEQERFWFSSGGKHQVKKVALLLNKFGVDWRAVLDLDALLDWALLTEIAQLKGLDIGSHKKAVASALRAMLPPDLAAVRHAAQHALFGETDDESAINNALKELQARKISTPLKQNGLSAVPKGQERVAVEALLSSLRERGILLLSKGELECYVPTAGGHGPAWVNTVLESPDEYSSELDQLRDELALVV